MLRKQLFSCSLGLLLAGSLTGCAGSSGFYNPFARAKGPPSDVMAQSAPRAGSSQSPLAPPTVSPGTSSAAPTAYQSFSSGVQKTAAGVGDALTIKPRVTPPNDPIALNSKGDKLGPDVHVKMAGVAEGNRDIAQATAHYRKALEISPKDRTTLLQYARFLDRQGDKAGAVRVYQDTLKHHPGDAMVMHDLGLCFDRQDRTDEALTMLAQAVQKSPGKPLYRNNLAMVLVRTGQAEKAVAVLQPALGEGGANYNVGALMIQNGDPRGAENYFARAIAADPKIEPARQMLAQLRGENNVPAQQQPAYDVRQPYQQPQQGEEIATRPQVESGNSPVRPAGASSRFDGPSAAPDYRYGDEDSPSVLPPVTDES